MEIDQIHGYNADCYKDGFNRSPYNKKPLDLYLAEMEKEDGIYGSPEMPSTQNAQEVFGQHTYAVFDLYLQRKRRRI